MKTTFKLSVAVLSVLMLVCMLMLGSCDGGDTGPTVNPPEAVYKVHSVAIKYKDATVEGTLTVDISEKEINVSANVQADSKADKTVTYTSSNTDVATVDQNGKITLVSEGETAIRAQAGNKTHTIILIVNDTFTEKESFTITVNGGYASMNDENNQPVRVTKAAPGEWVNLNAIIPEHQDFQRWSFSVRGVATNGNLFKMPEEDVVITAEYAAKLYQLNLVGVGKVYANGEELAGEVVGNTKDGKEAEYDIVSYGVPFNAELELTAMAAPTGKIFVGWDQGTINNRVGEMGVPTHSFDMPGENYTVWAHFSELTTKILTASRPNHYWDASKGSKLITNGSPADEAKDPDLEGLSGYRLTFSSADGPMTGYTTENIPGSVFNSIEEGTNTLKAIFKNHSDYEITLELYISFYGNIATTGYVTIPAHSTVTKYFTGGLGIYNPYFGIVLRESIQSISGIALVDVVLGSAPMYPEGDPLLRTTGKAELVKLNTDTDTQYNWGREFHYNEKYGLATYSIYGKQFSGNVPAARSVQITNMPEYDPENPETTIYARVINNANSELTGLSIFDICVSTYKDTRNVDITSFATVTHEKVGDVVLIKIVVPRTANDGPFYLSVRKTTVENANTYYPHNFSIVLAYNNVFGYEE